MNRKASLPLKADDKIREDCLTKFLYNDYKLKSAVYDVPQHIATCYGLDGLGIESRWGTFSAPVQTVPGGQPPSDTISTGSLSPGVKWH
jgi:hypothetical protein